MSDISMELKLEIAENTFSNAEEYYKNFFKAYRERLELYYQGTFVEHPDYFIFKLPVEVVLVLENYNYYTFYLRSENEDQVRYITDFFDDSKEYQEIKDLPIHIQEERILKLLNIEMYLEKDTSNYGFNFPKPKISYWNAEMYGKEKCDEHFQNYKFAVAFREASKPEDIFPLFEMEPIYSKINDEQFKYELSEAVKAYNSDLFLASIVTAAVSLETMLKISIARLLGPQYLPTDDRKKHTLNYAQILLENQIIDERLNHRIRALNELRRSGAHSKSGTIKHWDAEQVISGIRIIVDSIYN